MISGLVPITADQLHWWDGQQWQPSPWPVGTQPLPPCWDGYQWRWDMIQAPPLRSGAMLRRIARVSVWIEAAIWGAIGGGFIASARYSTTVPDALRVHGGGVVTLVGAVLMGVAGARWMKLRPLKEWVLVAHALIIIGILAAYPIIITLAVITAIPAVVGILVADQRDTQLAMGGAHFAAGPVNQSYGNVVTPGAFTLCACMTALGFLVGLYGAFDPNIPGNNPLPAAVIGLVVGLVLGVASVAGWRLLKP